MTSSDAIEHDNHTEAEGSPGRVDSDVLAQAVEAVLMVSDQPVSLLSLAQVTGHPLEVVRQVVNTLVERYDGAGGQPRSGFELREVAGGWRLYARAEFDDLIRSFVHDDSPQRLSQAALETLAVVAYKQPVTRPQVSAVRAVNVDSVMRTLLARGLITESSTDQETGAIYYETTPLMLEYLGIESLDDLPPLSPLLDDGSAGFTDVDT